LEEADKQGDPRQTVGRANLQQQFSALVGVLAVELDPARRPGRGSIVPG
jgi:hypothetical protein